MIPISATNVVALTAGLYHSLALKADCTVVGWGAGQSGDSYVQNYFYDQAKPSSRATNVLAIAAGKFHTLALKADGTVVGWGYNYHGQATGVPKTTTPPISSGLVSVSGETLSNMVAIAAGGNHSLALKADGSVVGWGYTVEGQSTIPSSANGAVAIAEGNSHCLALKPDGTVVGWGNNYYGQATGVATNSSPPYYASGIVIVSGQKLSNVVAIAAGDSHSLALKADGTVVGWGANGRGQTTIPASATNNVVAIAAGLAHSLALKADGTLVVWGYNLLRQTNTPANVTDLAAWGERPAGLWNIPSVSSPITAVASGSAHNVALTASGSVLAWGLNTWGEINVPLQAQSGVQAIGSGLGHNLALTANGSVLAWGLNDFGQTNVPTSAQSGVVAISVGGKHNLALRTNGTVVAWGLNGSGQTNVPPNLQGKVVAIGAGGEHSLALKADGAVVAWGGNTSGQTNVLPQAQSGVVAIAAGRYHNLALKSTGQVVAWGLNSSGQCDVPAEAQSGVVAVAAGYRQSLALMADGSVVRWGRNNSTIPASATNVVAIAAGDTHSLFLTASGAAGSAGSGGMESVRAQIPRGLPFFLRGGNDSVIAELGRVGPLQSTGTELSGAKALLAAVLELGMPYTLERDDVLHGFLYGSESLVDLDASRTFLEAENVRQQAAPDSPPVLLPDVAVLRYQRLADRLNLCLTNLAATGQPEIPRLVGHTYARARAGA
jgi:alpha-tubulin suppressor-like RCC1 family protein